MLVFEELGKPKYPEKPLGARTRTKNKLKPTYVTEPGLRFRFAFLLETSRGQPSTLQLALARIKSLASYANIACVFDLRAPCIPGLTFTLHLTSACTKALASCVNLVCVFGLHLPYKPRLTFIPQLTIDGNHDSVFVKAQTYKCSRKAESSR